MKKFHVTFLVLMVTIASGCAGKGLTAENFYEGAKLRARAAHPDVIQEQGELGLSYEQYEAERKKLRGNSDPAPAEKKQTGSRP